MGGNLPNCQKCSIPLYEPRSNGSARGTCYWLWRHSASVDCELKYHFPSHPGTWIILNLDLWFDWYISAAGHLVIYVIKPKWNILYHWTWPCKVQHLKSNEVSINFTVIQKIHIEAHTCTQTHKPTLEMPPRPWPSWLFVLEWHLVRT